METLWRNTPPKTNISPENQWLEDVFPIEKGPFLGDMLVFGGVMVVKLPPHPGPVLGGYAILTFSHDGSMRLEDLPTWMAQIYGGHVGKHSTFNTNVGKHEQPTFHFPWITWDILTTGKATEFSKAHLLGEEPSPFRPISLPGYPLLDLRWMVGTWCKPDFLGGFSGFPTKYEHSIGTIECSNCFFS